MFFGEYGESNSQVADFLYIFILIKNELSVTFDVNKLNIRRFVWVIVFYLLSLPLWCAGMPLYKVENVIYKSKTTCFTF